MWYKIIKLAIQRTPHPQKLHHQISIADLPANRQSNFIFTFNNQYRAETWTLRATAQKRLEGFEMWCWRTGAAFECGKWGDRPRPRS